MFQISRSLALALTNSAMQGPETETIADVWARSIVSLNFCIFYYKMALAQLVSTFKAEGSCDFSNSDMITWHTVMSSLAIKHMIVIFAYIFQLHVSCTPYNIEVCTSMNILNIFREINIHVLQGFIP